MNKEDIKSRLDELEVVKEKLKQKFIGIDIIIDSFIDNVKIWYAVPELQMRPLIVNLWGMTGVGKTDLIRTFVKLIKFNDKFIELQMDNLNKGWYGESCIQYHLESVLEDSNMSGILLLDEMQRFKTVDDMGGDLPKDQLDKFSDVWTLLSDGKFSNDSSHKKSLMELFYELIYEIEEKNNATEQPKTESTSTDTSIKTEQTKKSSKYKTYYWRAKRIRSLLKLEDSVEKIMMWDSNIIMDKIVEALKSSDTFDGTSYSKLLIIISGNLDEAYHMSYETNDSDVDADIYHEYSKKITMLDIKKALTKRFKPEQIARFGNIHLIYPSLNKDAYMKIIKMKCDEIISRIKEKSNINISFDETVYKVIYRNGVFPTQGVRPLLSTISALIENSLPHFMYHCLLKNINNLHISFEESCLYARIGEETTKYKVNTVIDDIKKKKDTNSECLIAVHEVGHAIAYMELFNLIPLQLVCNTASSDSGGFLMPHQSTNSKDIVKNKIILSLAGQVAEEIIFGENKKSSGARADIVSATNTASDYVRSWGMDGFVGNVYTVGSHQISTYGIIEPLESNKAITSLLNDCKIAAQNIINLRLPLLKQLTLKLLEEKMIKEDTIYNISKEFYKDIQLKDTSFLINEEYTDLMNKKFNSIK